MGETINMSHTTTYLSPLIDAMTVHANPTLAVPMAKYMRDLFPFLGIKTPERTAIVSDFLKVAALPPAQDLTDIVQQLWEMPQREYQYVAISLVEKCQRKRQTDASLTDLLQYMISHRSWWDSVDSIAHLVGNQWLLYPEQLDKMMPSWVESDNMWLNRVSIIYQLHYKQKTNAQILFDNIRVHAQSKEFFIQKAIGWALRQYAYIAPEAVRQFVDSCPLSALSVREALKHIGR